MPSFKIRIGVPPRLIVALTLLALLLPSQGCVSFGPSPQELVAWRDEQEQIRTNIEKDLQPLRKEVAETRITQPFFWEVTKDGKTSWLLGTMHLGVSAGSLPNAVHRRLVNADAVVMEADIAKMESEQRRYISRQLGAGVIPNTLPAGQTLQTLLGPKAWGVYQHALLPLDPDLYIKLTPAAAWRFYIEARTTFLMPQAECMDCAIQDETRLLKKRLVPLETYSESMMALSRIKDDEQLSADQLADKLLHNPLGEVRSEITEFYRTSLAYKKGDLKIIRETFDVDQDFYKYLIAGRNKAWLAKLDKELAKGNVFVAVGAAHMSGPDSLIKLLQARGYKVRRWSSASLL